MEYGLIGENVSFSYSKIIHEKFGLYDYKLCSISLSEFKNLLRHRNFKGLNITMPYKKTAISFCDVVSSEAKKTGSVNTLFLTNNNKITGHNTDYFGLKFLIERSGISLKNKKILILGSGGTSNTAYLLAKNLNAKSILVVSRTGNLNYENICKEKDSDIIINTTPIGMYPNNLEKLICVSKFKNLSGVIDVIYNPFLTNLLFQAKKSKIPVASGLQMLVAQAKYSAEIFKNIKLDDSIIEKITKELILKLSNIVIIGMPGSGKSEISKIISKKLGKKLIDSDDEIQKLYKASIFEIFKKYGEENFRKIESAVLEKYGKINNLVLSTGGGAVLNKKNHFLLKQNARIYWIKRDLNLLETTNRPLSKNLNKIYKMYEKRKPMYNCFCDKIIYNNNSIEGAAALILKDFYENIET